MADNKAQTQEIYFVRHAEKMQTPGDRDPGLTETGQRRAEALAALMLDVPLQAVYATAYQRTRLTATPTAKQKSLPLQQYDARESVAFVQQWLQSGQPGPILVVGHSNTLPEMLRAAGIAESASEFDESLYGDLYKVKIQDGSATVQKSRFGE